jgi:sulfatase modifying factor 1
MAVESFPVSRGQALAACALIGTSLVATASADAVPDCTRCPQMATIPAGTFQMGKMVDYGYGDMDGPTHAVTIARPFDLAVHEVTLGEFRTFVKATGYISEKKCNVYDESTTWHIDPMRNWADPGFPQEESHPVVCVSWRDAQAYIRWLNGETGRTYRLPSEAEWEYTASVANLGDTRDGGSITHDIANIGKAECCGGETGGRDTWIYTSPVGSFPADRLGVHDQRGNVWEWQDDCYHVDYEGAPADGSPRATCPTPGFRVVRGGSYGDASEYMGERFRLRGTEDQGYFTVGFRLAQTIEPPS